MSNLNRVSSPRGAMNAADLSALARIDAGSLLKRGESYLSLLIPLTDMVGTCATAVAAYWISWPFALGQREWPWPGHYSVASAIALILVVPVMHSFGVYRAWRGDTLPRELIRSATAWATMLVALIVLAALTKSTTAYSRTWFGAWFVSGLLGLWGSRIFFRAASSRLRSRGLNLKQIVLVGSGSSLIRVAAAVRAAPGSGFVVAGYFSEARSRNPALQGVRFLGDLESLSQLTDAHYEQVWLAFPADQKLALRHALDAVYRSDSQVRLIPDLEMLQLVHAAPAQMVGMPVLDLNGSPLAGMGRLVKDIEDKVLAAAVLLLTAPLMLLIAIGIRLSSRGPVFFMQQRGGWRGHRFMIYKFRTMHLHEEPQGCVTQARKNDSRVFAFGRLLRRTSLDELPQLFNVLRGEMSLVGPRPHSVEHDSHYFSVVNRYIWRHSVKPGITGWAQVNGLRGETETVDMMERRLEHDLFYIRNWSVWLDIEILLMTLIRGFVDPRAY